jgi:putative membrane protein
MMGFGFGGIGMIIFWVVVLAAIFFVVRGLQNQSHRHETQPPSPSPMDLLKRRYAAGEISKEEFESRRRDLERT